MNVLQYNDLHPGRLRAAFDRTVAQLQAGNFRAADVKKLDHTPFYRAKLSDADRLIFRFGLFRGEIYLLLLEIIEHHAYENSRFLNGAKVDDAKLAPLPDARALPAADVESLSYVNPRIPHFHLLNKIISFDEFQHEAFHLSPPLILIGSAGSGKTALTLEKMKLLNGDILYITLSPYLAEYSRNLYYTNHYQNEDQTPEFLSFRELIESLRVPEGRPMNFRVFSAWYARHRQTCGIKDAHMLYEEFNGVITGSPIDQPALAREDYLALGVRQSIFSVEQRPQVYALFEKYRRWMAEEGWYDFNMTAHSHLALARASYDFVVVDEAQDLTNIQLHLILQTLREPSQFMLCGDANQIVHPNFFSWSGIKSMFYERRINGHAEILRVLNGNFRNSPQVTEIANRLLLVKNARFGSIDRESNYLVRCVSEKEGAIEFLSDAEPPLRDLNAKTARSTHFAVIVMREEDKPAARRIFQTPLLFSIQEAKGLEYENIIIFGFVSGCRKEFDAIVEGVTPEALARDTLVYARAKDKTDKSLEAFKFFINALYVGITRAICTLYWIEHDTGHRLFKLLNLTTRRPAVLVKNETSSLDEWRQEARKLELQGKQEQADTIRRTLLGAQPVPWKIITPDAFEDLRREALDPARFNKQAKQLLYEYALVYSVPHTFDELVLHKFTRAAVPDLDRVAVENKYLMDYREKSLAALKRKIDLHGVDFRNQLNQTPLMLAARLGLTDAIQWLLKEGADQGARDNWGRLPLQIALRQALLEPAYAHRKLGAAYDLLAPSALKVKVDGRMIKIDRSRMEFFLLHSMMALFQEILRVKIRHRIPAFETGDFIHALAHFPEPVIPHRRRKRSYITSVLARNELYRPGPGNRRLFARVSRGFYLPNPAMEIEVNELWINIYDLLRTDLLAREKDNEPLQYLLGVIDQIRQDIAAGRHLNQAGQDEIAPPDRVSSECLTPSDSIPP